MLKNIYRQEKRIKVKKAMSEFERFLIGSDKNFEAFVRLLINLFPQGEKEQDHFIWPTKRVGYLGCNTPYGKWSFNSL